MKVRSHVVPLAVIAVAALLVSAGCGGSGCPTQTSGSTGGGSSTGSGVGITSSCGTSGGTTPTTSVLLYYIDATGTVQGASLSTTGTFSALSGYTPPAVTVGGDTRDMVIADKQFLYFPQGTPSVVQGYSINHTTGALTAIPGSPFPTSGGDTIIADHLGRFIFISNSASGEVSAFQIDATTGKLTQSQGSPFTAFNVVSGYNLAVDGASKYLYISQGNASLPTAGFSFDQSSGALTPIAGSPFSIGVAGVRAESTGLYLVGASGLESDNHLYVFSIESGTGVPFPVPNSPFPTTYAPYNIAVSPVAAFVYNFGTDSTGVLQVPEGFSLDLTSGALSELSDSPFTSLPAVPVCRFEQTGTEMFCPGATGTTFSVFGANSTTGALTFTVPNLTVTYNYPFAVTD
jgi:6-phosphogluconolactonase